MVSLIVGFPGSGKSYYAIDKIYNILNGKDKLSDEIDIIYTNINGVKFDMFPDSKVQFKKLNLDDLYSYLTQCYNVYELKKNSDDVDSYLIELSKDKGFYKSYIVFDECHDFFTPQDKIKIFWLTYHRHLFHEIVLLTQNKSLIHSKYRAIPEIFIEAQPRSKKLFDKSLTYKSYASFAMRKTDMFNKFNINTNDEVFSLYKSGNKSNQKSILLKFIIIIGIGVLFSIILFWYLFDSFTSSDTSDSTSNIKNITNTKNETSNINMVLSESISNNKSENKINNDFYSIALLCDSSMGCIVFDNTYSINYINKFLKNTDSKSLYTDVLYIDKNSKTRIYKYYIYTSNNDLKKYFVTDFETKIKTSTQKLDFNNLTQKVQL